jgi:hypothetical protein
MADKMTCRTFPTAFKLAAIKRLKAGQAWSEARGRKRRQRARSASLIRCAVTVIPAALFGSVARRSPGRYRHVIPYSSIIRPFFGQDCTECWRLVEPTDRRPSASDDIGRKGRRQ